MAGRLILSLDFELHWGVFDHLPLDEPGKAYFLRARKLIPPTLLLFQTYGIRATWATVGFLFAPDKTALLGMLPAILPNYEQAAFNPYPLLEGIGENEEEDPYHFASSLIQQIAATPGQRIGSHTFSHYYCLEPQQQTAAFAADLAAAQQIAATYHGLPLRSLVFPRNQYSAAYLGLLSEAGIQSYRTNPDIWFWRARTKGNSDKLVRGARLLDHYFPLDRDTSFECGKAVAGLVDIPASRLFRPYLGKLDGFGGQQLKIQRICGEMTEAAKNKRDYHLWWHPHNLATHPEKNMAALKTIALHYTHLREKYGMQSASMEDVAEKAW